MKVRMPHNAAALLLGGLAVVIASTGTAVAATGQIVNIADPTTAANKAKVDSSGRLNVTGPVTANPAAPSTFFHGVGSINSSGGCVPVYIPPAGKAAVVLNLQATAYAIGTPSGSLLRFWISSTSSPCGSAPTMFMAVGDKPATVVQSLQAGWGIPTGSALYADVFNAGDEWLATAQGYTTASATVPAAAAVPAAAPAQTGPAAPTR
jgi:hypothetical protein